MSTERQENQDCQTARERGTYGGRQRRLSLRQNGENHTTNPLRIFPRVTTKSVESYLNSLGYSIGDYEGFCKKEIDQIAVLRKEFDILKDLGARKENEILKLEESFSELQKIDNDSKNSLSLKASSLTQLENRIMSIENQLEEQSAESSVYKHMLNRLADELHQAKLITRKKESENAKLSNELEVSLVQLVASRQEKEAAEQLFRFLQTELVLSREEKNRVLEEIEVAAEQTHMRLDMVKQREKTRTKLMAQANGELSEKQLTKLNTASIVAQFKYNQLSQETVRTDKQFREFEEKFYRLAEAAGTFDTDKIIAKYLACDGTLENLKKEYYDAESKMKRLREKHQQLKEKMQTLRGNAKNTRGDYMEMDEISNKLKEMEKLGAATEEKCQRAELSLESLKTSMIKSNHKLNTIKESFGFIHEYDTTQKKDSSLYQLYESSLVELIMMTDSKLSRVLDSAGLEKGDSEVLKSESTHQQTKKGHSSKSILPDETDEHFILRVCKPDVSKNNVRIQPPINSAIGEDIHTLVSDEPIDENEAIVDRSTRKKLAGMVINREKKGFRGA